MSNPKTEINNGLPDNNLFRFVTAFLRIEVVEMRMQKELTVTKWKKNWVTFMDNVMQMIIIDLETTDLFEFVVNKDNRSTEKLDSPIVWDTSNVLLLAEINVNVFTFPSKLGSEDIPKDVTILESYMTEMDGGFLLFPKNRNKSLDILILQELELRIVSEIHTSVEFRILSKKKKKIPENMMIIKVHSNDLTDRKKCLLNFCLLYEIFSWIVPDSWNSEHAATVLCVYCIYIASPHINGELQKGERTLIHAGSGGIGQAAISLALPEGC
ncbi:fatty acid synthase-like [Vespula maculifrons]|uniref:Fatty acid synthase-like n=1 Tax=Vespula maculifrons TaxID=7453 RepID=A0ABD2CT84_VESMC